MKYVATLLLGLATGVLAAIALLYFNPLAGQASLNPLSVSDNELVVLSYSAVAQDMIAYTNDGESIIKPYPEKILQLWERPIRSSEAFITPLKDSRNVVVGIGIKFQSAAEATRIVNGEALINSVWYVYLPDRGSLFMEQVENYWDYMREIVVPAYWSSADSWKGSWFGNVTSGPNSLGTGRVVGISGEFAGMASEAVESLSARAYSMAEGPVAVDGRLTIELLNGEAPVAAGSTNP